MDEQLLGELHEVVVVRVGLVELQHGEFGVVLGGGPLVPERAVDLVHAFEPAHHQPLEVELRGDAQVQRHVEGVVVGDERPRGGAAGDGLHHRRLDLEEAARVEERPHFPNDSAPEDEGLADVGVHHEVHVAPPVARLHVLQAVPLGRERAQGLGEELELLHRHRELAGAGAHELAGDADEIPHVEVPEEGKALAEGVRAGIELQGPRPVAQVGEARLAVVAEGDDAAGEAHLPGALELVLARVLPARGDVARPVGNGKAPAEGIHAPRPQGLELLVPPPDQLVGVGGGTGRRRRRHHASAFPAEAPGRAPVRKARMKGSMSPSITASTLPISTPVRWSLMIWYGWKV